MSIDNENEARMNGYTEEYLADCDMASCQILVRPGTDLDSTFKAYDADNCEMLRINGWLWTFEPAY